tara:strand:+ start:509 stop:901 length:393 start_codon:yes stop_codon:yes gene_type:complete
MKGNGIHMKDNDNDSTVSASAASSQHPNATPQTSGASTPNTLEQEHDHAFDHATLEADYFNEHLPRYEAESQDYTLKDEPHANDDPSTSCAVLPHRQAVWMEKTTKLKLSALAAGALIDAEILTRKNLSL